jgi:hypothetical protein
MTAGDGSIAINDEGRCQATIDFADLRPHGVALGLPQVLPCSFIAIEADGQIADILHSYLGLATLSLLKAPDLKTVDPSFCMSQDAVDNLKHSAWWSAGRELKQAC